MTKQEQRMLNKFIKAIDKRATRLPYKKPSQFKKIVAERLQREASEHGAILYFCGSSSFTFSAGFSYKKDGQNRLHYYTANNTYDFAI